MTHSHKHKAQNNKLKKAKEEIRKREHDGSEKIKTEVKDAHASGIGALGRSEENQIEKIDNNKFENDDTVY